MYHHPIRAHELCPGDMFYTAEVGEPGVYATLLWKLPSEVTTFVDEHDGIAIKEIVVPGLEIGYTFKGMVFALNVQMKATYFFVLQVDR